MDYKKYSDTLILVKLDLGISHAKRDAYYNALLYSAEQELSEKGIHLDLNCVEDQMLLSDYAVWRYRNREQDIPLAKNLEIRIMNRKVKGRTEKNVEG